MTLVEMRALERKARKPDSSGRTNIAPLQTNMKAYAEVETATPTLQSVGSLELSHARVRSCGEPENRSFINESGDQRALQSAVLVSKHMSQWPGLVLAAFALSACGSRETPVRASSNSDKAFTVATDKALLAVWADTTKDAWAVGDGGTIVHFDGQKWALSESGTDEQLSAVHGSAPDNVWAVGDNGTTLHYDGKAWSTSSTEAGSSLLGVWTSGPDDVWAAGIYTFDNIGYLRHWDGTAWEGLEIPGSSSLWEVWGSDPTDIWMVGTTISGAGLVLHGDGRHFEALTYSGTPLRSIWGTDAAQVWVAQYDGSIQRWDGSAWQSDVSPATGLLGLWGTDSNNLWAVGLSGAVVHSDGQEWSSSPVRTTKDLWSISGTADDDVWAVGAGGTILRYTGDGWHGPTR